ncbi:MAG: tRNA (N(6)-L-threonylcarbamoyladenosine(37)-C(2))-methylthiotransferase MtaB [Treponema sp.]|jgi:threonylcarbamoyladenosine tRNA methylthiotransferase MtaB|nr:tRNA (N(6)-L-threonylcarbamoyladenosine(37)-C(2))-methylthiotransferase MtaB [Treponema sp.]
MYSFSIYTLGCKLNQLESEAVAASFREAGFTLRPWEEGADILVVNTCTVTSMAEQKARRIIRKLLKDNPASRVIVTGCYAQLEAEKIAALEDGKAGSERRLFVVPGNLKPALLDLPRRMGGGMEGRDLAALLEPYAAPDKTTQGKTAPGKTGQALPRQEERGDPFAFNAPELSFHSRPFLKIQDGCDHACAYCRVSIARGSSVSLDADTVLRRLRSLEDRGYAEAVLSGVNISQYRDERRGDLGALVAFLLENTGRIALRLSSLEPEALTGSLLPVLGERRIRPHFHLSLQSGSDRVLARMGRPYTAGEAAAAAEKLRALKDDPFLACDIIAGFPGESGEDFAGTVELCEGIGFAWIHAFPYSARPETPAFRFKDPVSRREVSSRVETLNRLAKRGKAAYVGRWLGRTVEAVPERFAKTSPDGSVPAVSENYLKVLLSPFPGGESNGGAVRCRIFPLKGRKSGEDRFDAGGEPLTRDTDIG